MKKYFYGNIIALICVAVGIVLHFLMPEVDAGLFTVINGMHFDLLDKIMLSVSYCGDTVVIIIALLLLGRLKGAEKFLRSLLAVVLAGVLVHLIKGIFPSPRPLGVLADVRVLGPALRVSTFPSGHACSIFALGVVTGEEFKNLFPFYLALAILVGISRIYVGAHFPADVIFGAGLGYLAGNIYLAGRKSE